MPDSAPLAGYANDVAAIIVTRYIEEPRRKVNLVIIIDTSCEESYTAGNLDIRLDRKLKFWA